MCSGPFSPLSVGSAAALQWQREVGNWAQIVLNAIMDELIMCSKTLKDSAVGGLDAHYKITLLNLVTFVDLNQFSGKQNQHRRPGGSFTIQHIYKLVCLQH